MIERGTEANQLPDQLSSLGIPGDEAGADIAGLYARSWSLELPLIDYLTIRDLLELSDCQGDVSLVAVLMTLFGALEEGSLCVDLEEAALCERLTRFLEAKQAEGNGKIFSFQAICVVPIERSSQGMATRICRSFSLRPAGEVFSIFRSFIFMRPS